MSATATARNVLGPLVRLGYRVRVTGAHHCPARGPLIVVAPYTSLIDPTIVATCLPRPVDVLVEPGALSAMGARIPGRIVSVEDDPAEALRRARSILDGGGAVGAWCGESRERAAGYLSTTTGARILPLIVFSDPSARPAGAPAWRSAVDVVIGEPFTVDVPPDPIARAAVLGTGEVIRQRVADLAERAGVRLGRADRVDVDTARRSQPGAAPDNGAL